MCKVSEKKQKYRIFLLILQSKMKMKEIYEYYPKEKINTLPIVKFDGRVFVVITERDADKAVEYLMTQRILGFDSETRPSFKKWQHHKVSLLQVSTHDTCFLFRLNQIGICDSLVRLLQDHTIIKVGLSLKDDFRQLQQRRKFEPGTFVDLQSEVKKLGVEDASLQKLYANLFGQKISKTQQLSNWEADVLSEAQKLYAATDAWACVKLYEEIQRLLKECDFTLINNIISEE